MIKNFRHTGLVTTNLKQSMNFYVKLLGLEKIKEINENEKLMNKVLYLNNCKLKTIKLGVKKKIFLELLYFKNFKKNKKKIKIYTPGLTHISLTVKNLSSLHKKLKKAKVNFLSNPCLSHDKKVKLVFCKSPENIFIELVEII